MTEPVELNCYLNKKSVRGILDSGASLSVVSFNLVNPKLVFKIPYIKLKSASNGLLRVVGKINLNIVIENVEFRHNFIVIQSPSDLVIFGNDFNSKYQCDINFLTNSVKLICDKKSHCFKFANAPQGNQDLNTCFANACNRVCTSAETEILPNASTKVGIHFQENAYQRNSLFEPRQGRLSEQPTLKIVNFIESYAYFTNETNKPIIMLKDTEIGRFRSDRDDDNVEISDSWTKFSVNKSPVEQQEESVLKITVEKPRKEIRESVEHNKSQFVSIEKLSNINDELTMEQKDALFTLLTEYSDVFATSNYELGRTNVCEQKIETGDAIPVHQPPYRVSPREREIISEQISEMLQAGIIRRSRSSWASPVVLVKKRTGDWRFCVDYRNLNRLIKLDTYPLPVISDILTSLQGSCYFSTLDLFSGFWQINLTEDAKQKTAFITPDGLHEFQVLPFGLASSPACFQRCMDQVLAGLKWKSCLVYLDDIIVKGKTFEEHLENLKEILNRLREANLKLKPSKCHFGKTKIKVLGHVACPQGISPDPEKVQAVKNFPRPKKVVDVQSFIGLANYYRKFVRGFADIARPLTLLTRKNTRFIWTDEQEIAFQTLKEALIKAPVLRHFEENLPIEIHVDASNYGIGAIILQSHPDGNTYPIAYASRRLSEAEIKFNTTEKECLGFVYAVSQFRHFIWGKPFKIVTDHHALCWLHKNRDASGRLVRWAIKLQDYTYEIVHKSGKRHADADSLSRNPVDDPTLEDQHVDEIPILMLQAEKIAEFQTRDPKLNKLIDAINNPENADAKIVKQSRSFFIDSGVLYKKNFTPDGRTKLLVVPDKLKHDVLLCCHDDPMTGAHLGIAKTYGKIRNRYYWDNMFKEIEAYVKSCTHCQHRKNVPRAPAGLLQPIKVGSPFKCIGVDFLGPFPKSKSGNTFIITATDYATRWAEARAVTNSTAETVANFLIESILCRHGCVEQIITDRGKCFQSKLIRSLLEGIGSHPTFTTAYHPATNGLTEHYNGTLATMLSMYVSTDQKDWCSYVSLVTFAFNTSPQPSTKQTPFLLVYGREARLPIDVSLGVNEDRNETVTEMLERIQKTRQHAVESIAREQEKQKKRFDKTHREVEYKIGEEVLLYTPYRKVGKSEKLLHRWGGPYKVTKKLNDVNYEIEMRKGNKVWYDTVHVNRMKSFHQRR